MKLLIGIPLHNNVSSTIKNLTVFLDNHYFLKKLNINVHVYISCDNNLLDLKVIYERFVNKVFDNIKIDLIENKSNEMVDNWNSALHLFKSHDYCYLLHDDDLINANCFFNELLPVLVKVQPNILAFNSYLTYEENNLKLQKIIEYSELLSSKEYFENLGKRSFPAPSQTIFKLPFNYGKNVYTNLQKWCPETKLYLDIMKNSKSKFLMHKMPGVYRGIHKNQVSNNTMWKGAVDLAVMGGMETYVNEVESYFDNTNILNDLDYYFQSMFKNDDFYQKDNFKYIMKFISKNNKFRFLFLNNLSLFISSEFQKNTNHHHLINKISFILSNTFSKFFCEKIIRTMELTVIQIKQKTINRNVYDYEEIKQIDAEFQESIYSSEYISSRLLSIVSY